MLAGIAGPDGPLKAACLFEPRELLIMPYGSNFVNVGFLAPGSTFLLLIDADAVLRQFWKGFDLAWIAETRTSMPLR